MYCRFLEVKFIEALTIPIRPSLMLNPWWNLKLMTCFDCFLQGSAEGYGPLLSPRGRSCGPGCPGPHGGSWWSRPSPWPSGWWWTAGGLTTPHSACRCGNSHYHGFASTFLLLPLLLFNTIINTQRLFSEFKVTNSNKQKYTLLSQPHESCDLLSEQAHEVVGCVGVQAEGRHGDVRRSVRPVLVVVLQAVEHRVGHSGLPVDHLTCRHNVSF